MAVTAAIELVLAPFAWARDEWRARGRFGRATLPVGLAYRILLVGILLTVWPLARLLVILFGRPQPNHPVVPSTFAEPWGMP